MKSISAVVITLNEEENIRQCLESLSVADEIVVIDSMSSDRTVEIAKEYTDNVFVIDWTGYSDAKNQGVDKASNDWILSIDADERVSDKLNQSLEQFKSSETTANGYRLSRRTWYLKRWIKGGGWYPDQTLRLFNRNHGRFNDKRVHESVGIEGEVSTLPGDILHYSYKDISDHYMRICKYSQLCAETWLAEGRKPSLVATLFRPPWEFFRKLVLRKGYIDGWEGVIVAGMHSIYVFMKYIKLYELNLNNTRKDRH